MPCPIRLANVAGGTNALSKMKWYLRDNVCQFISLVNRLLPFCGSHRIYKPDPHLGQSCQSPRNTSKIRMIQLIIIKLTILFSEFKGKSGDNPLWELISMHAAYCCHLKDIEARNPPITKQAVLETTFGTCNPCISSRCWLLAKQGQSRSLVG